MKTLMTVYVRFVQTLSDMGGVPGPHPDYDTLCRRLRISPNSLDEILLDELGFTGMELMKKLQNYSKYY